MTISTNTNSHWSGSRRGGCAQLRGGSKNWALIMQGWPSQAGSKSLGCGARALRKHACDAIAKRQTVHVRVRLQMKGARDDIN
eukprot:5381990-Pleurochrysis_carterae.AAC.1